MAKISEVFGFKSRSSLCDLIATWDREGVLERVRQAMLLLKAEEIRAATSNVLNQWPLVIERVLKIAIHDKSDRNALEAAAWLKQEIIDPALAEQEESGSSEAAWSRKPDVPLPTTITIPSFLVKKTG